MESRVNQAMNLLYLLSLCQWPTVAPILSSATPIPSAMSKQKNKLFINLLNVIFLFSRFTMALNLLPVY